MAHADFVHLRVHSAYSLSEGAIKVEALADLCRRHAMPALAVTDSGNLFGALEISQAMMAAGVQPIIGCQIALARDDKETFGSPRPAPDQLVLLAAVVARRWRCAKTRACVASSRASFQSMSWNRPNTSTARSRPPSCLAICASKRSMLRRSASPSCRIIRIRR